MWIKHRLPLCGAMTIKGWTFAPNAGKRWNSNQTGKDSERRFNHRGVARSTCDGNFAKMQMIFKAITGSSGHAFWWERTVLHSIETIVGRWSGSLGSISPGKNIYYGTLRCRTLHSNKNYPRQQPAPWFLRQILLSLVQCRTTLSAKGCDRNFLLSLWIWFASYHNSITPRSWKHL